MEEDEKGRTIKIALLSQYLILSLVALFCTQLSQYLALSLVALFCTLLSQHLALSLVALICDRPESENMRMGRSEGRSKCESWHNSLETPNYAGARR